MNNRIRILLGTAAVLATTVGAQAADLPTRKSAPVQYVKVCDAYGAGFFYIPGTDTCLRVGGVVLAAAAVTNTPYAVAPGGAATANSTLAGTAFAGGAALYTPPNNRDATSYLTAGIIETDARTQTQWGTLRTFIKVLSFFGSGQVFATGGGSPFNNINLPGAPMWSGMPYAARETTTIDKAFVQFAGLTAGRIQSMFDFYADQIGFTPLRGSNQTVAAFAYTAAFGGGMTATLSLEDAVSHRGPVATVVGAYPNLPGVTPIPLLDGTRIPDIVANLRIDQPWGSAQLSAAAHQVRASVYTGFGMPVIGAFGGGNSPPGSGTLATTNSMGFAIQGGVKFKLDMLSPGDTLWLQATYANGAIGYVSGSNMAYVNGVNTSNNYGVGLARVSAGNGWNVVLDNDCVFTYTGGCSKSSAFAFDAALRHYWTPTVSSTLTGNYYQVRYSGDATNPLPGAVMMGGMNNPFNLGMTNYKEITVATGLIWSPIKNFEIGGEVQWTHGMTSRPVGMGSDFALMAAGMPAFKSQTDLFRGSLRVLRAF